MVIPVSNLPATYNIATHNNIDIDIDSPPPRGVGTVCELRSFGTSIKDLLNEYFRIKPVVIKENRETTIRNETNKSIFMKYYNTRQLFFVILHQNYMEETIAFHF